MQRLFTPLSRPSCVWVCVCEGVISHLCLCSGVTSDCAALFSILLVWINNIAICSVGMWTHPPHWAIFGLRVSTSESDPFYYLLHYSEYDPSVIWLHRSVSGGHFWRAIVLLKEHGESASISIGTLKSPSNWNHVRGESKFSWYQRWLFNGQSTREQGPPKSIS